MDNRKADQAGAETIGTPTRGSTSVGCASRGGGQATRMPVPLWPVHPHLWLNVPGGGQYHQKRQEQVCGEDETVAGVYQIQCCLLSERCRPSL